ncbi:septum formation initiator family protein [Micrococcales bacterium 31B]|nr:septum formation initiator family protein [Micrococcales bacterium 31B]
MENSSSGAPQHGGRPSSASGVGPSRPEQGGSPGPRRARIIRAAQPVGGTRVAPSGSDRPDPARSATAPAKPAAGASTRPYFARISSFAWVMIGVGFICASSLVSSYVSVVRADQRIDALNAQNAAAAQELNALNGELARWNDPNYVKTQARSRLQYVMPGEIPFRILDSDGQVIADASQAVEQITDSQAPTTWYDNMWGTVKQADAAPRAVSLVPEEKQ